MSGMTRCLLADIYKEYMESPYQMALCSCPIGESLSQTTLNVSTVCSWYLVDRTKMEVLG